jgi:competence protein ComEA
MVRSAFSILTLAAALALAPGTVHSQEKPPARPAAGKAPVVKSPLNINTATAAEFEGLPGIGARTAARIVEYRQKNGPFKKVEELMNVPGVGEKSFLRLKAQLTLGPAKVDHNHER